MENLSLFGVWQESVDRVGYGVWIAVKRLSYFILANVCLSMLVCADSLAEAVDSERAHMVCEVLDGSVIKSCMVGGKPVTLLPQNSAGRLGSGIELVASTEPSGVKSSSDGEKDGRADANNVLVLKYEVQDDQWSRLIALMMFGLAIGMALLIIVFTSKTWIGFLILPVAWLLHRYAAITIWPFCTPGRLYERETDKPASFLQFIGLRH